jgi:hypothetical protein
VNTLSKLALLSTLLVSISACGITDITSSTSSTLDAVTPDVTANDFVNKRYLAIRSEAARGEGENLVALAQLLGHTDSRVFSQNLKEHFEQIFSQVTDPQDIIARIEAHGLHKG